MRMKPDGKPQWPWGYAKEIFEHPQSKWAELIQLVPTDLQDMTRTHLKCMRDRARCKRDRQLHESAEG